MPIHLKFQAQKADIPSRIRAIMFGQFRHLLLTAVWGLGLATAWGNASMNAAIAPPTGYLPQAGPLPLRFRPLPPPISDQDIMPPPPAPIILPSPPMPSKEPTPAPMSSVTNAPPLEFKAETAPVQPPMTAPEQVVSPQMLIKYFMAPNATNAVTNASPKALDTVGFTSPLGGGAPPPSKPAPSAPPNQK
jgi:hypothetical protein